VNTLISIVAIFLGALIWGAAGMILFIPFLGILKLVAQEVEGWQPVVTALGDEKPPHSKRKYFSIRTKVNGKSNEN
jgi:predicted PurR-regulated permease PerM